MRYKRFFALSLILVLLFNPITFFTILNDKPVPIARAELISPVMSYREWTHSGDEVDIRTVKIAGAIRTQIQPADNGHAWNWFTIDANFLNGTRLNVSSSGGGVYESRILILDGVYDRTDASQFKNISGSDVDYALVLQGAGILQVIHTGNNWANHTDSVIVNIANTFDDVTLMFASRGISLAGQTMDIYDVSIQPDGEPVFWHEGFQNGTLHNETATSDPRHYGYLDLDSFPPNPCQAEGVELMDPDADGWIIANNRFYTLKASWSNANFSTHNEYALAFTDGFSWINMTWSASNNTFHEDDGGQFIKITTTGGDWIYNHNETTGDLWVLFSIYMEEGILDSGPVDVYQKCDGTIGWILDDLGEGVIAGIYNDGGLIEASIINNASFTAGGDWFEVCAYSIGMAEVNQTWYKLQSFSTQFAVHIYENQSGLWVPEDQFFQTQQNAPGEKWASVQDWDIKIKVWGWDNVTSNYVLMSQAQMFMADGDEGATDQWVAIKTIFTDTLGVVEQKTWNAFIEEEPAARYRTWFDVWIDQQNASSVMGQRSNAYYFGMASGGWISFSNWAPMINNATEAIGYLDIHDGNDDITRASQIGMMKIEFELQFSGDPSSNSENTEYLVCIEDINIKETRLQAQGVALSGVNIPIYNAPKVPDMPIGGILAPLYSIIAGIASGIVEAFSGVASLIWNSILDQFPGLGDFITNTSALLVSSIELATSLIFYISNLFTWAGQFLQYIGLPINIITGTLGFLTDAVNTVIPENSRMGVVMILVMLQMTVLMDYLTSGRESYVFDFARNIWKMTGAIIDIAVKMANLTIRFLNLVNPF